MEQVLATRSVSITELKRSPSAVLEQAGDEPVAVLNHNRPAAYLLSPEVYASMLERLNADLHTTIQEGIDSGQGLAAEDVFAELSVRYAEPASPPATKSSGKRLA
ncbi:type II toxin-antitoxin system prevent-host-death family antitoxin [Rhodocyclus tenuis]|uniref:type II toxin-antitoxin system prevent-host-death family antitoxin n=1 Tax=Rhodocyclus tenuis TaxID=1066 RepID=UPI001906927F|nr:type II toxin-antitoxin system prevent-host-death family antitoxin [Rhodocyclus tenuis]MBK1679841.1 prevent-host-death protein [Rhodocyclus tenuis]